MYLGFVLFLIVIITTYFVFFSSPDDGQKEIIGSEKKILDDRSSPVRLNEDDTSSTETKDDIDIGVFEKNLQEIAIGDFGMQPIEGFDAYLLQQAFPGFKESDFNKVVTLGGEYKLVSGSLEYRSSRGDGPVTSADEMVTSVGYEILLKNVSERFDILLDDEENLDHIIEKLQQDPNNISIKAEFDGKIVYGTNQDSNVEALQGDCSRREGVFNECGSPCASDAEMCINVCAFTCEY